MPNIGLSGNTSIAARWIGFAMRKLVSLKQSMVLGRLKQSSQSISLRDANISIQSGYGLDIIRIEGLGGEATVFVTELNIPFRTPPNGRFPTQIFSQNGVFKKTFSDPNGVFPAGYDTLRHYDAVVYKNYVYVTNWWNGHLEKYTLNGVLVETLQHDSGISAVSQLSIASDLIAIASTDVDRNAYIYDMSYHLKYLINASLYPTTGISGIEIVGDKLYVAFDQDTTAPGSWHAFIIEFYLETGVPIRYFVIPPSSGKQFHSLRAYGGKLYAADTTNFQLFVYDLVSGDVDSVIDVSADIPITVFNEGTPPAPGPVYLRGLAVGKSGIWVTYTNAKSSGAYAATFSVARHYKGSTMMKEFGSVGTGNGQFQFPTGIALNEA